MWTRSKTLAAAAAAAGVAQVQAVVPVVQVQPVEPVPAVVAVPPVPAVEPNLNADLNIIYEDISEGQEEIPIPLCGDIDQLPEFEEIQIKWTYNKDMTYMQTSSYVTPMTSCDCTDDCRTVTRCLCRAKTSDMRNFIVKKKRSHLAYNPDRTLRNLHPGGLYECNASCACNHNRCKNRPTQKATKCRLYLRRNAGSRYGVFTKKTIPKDTFISRYTGRVLTTPQANRRSDTSYFFDLDHVDTVNSYYEAYELQIPNEYCEPSGNPNKDKNNIFRWLKNHYGELPESWVCDPIWNGNVGRFFNHSCVPNMYMQLVFSDRGIMAPAVTFFAKSQINAGEELRFDYGYGVLPIGKVNIRCDCGWGPILCRQKLYTDRT